ncbi:MAG TPA: PKD domain-containing protein [Planctomycetota bacterium]|nr:PKD domain-containing protein [Planctomycetota bacterium]
MQRTSLALATSLLLTAPFAAAQSCLNTINPFLSNNGGSVGGAIFFDLTVTGGVIVQSLTTNYSAAVGTPVGMTVYTFPTTYVGNTGSVAGWTLAGMDDGTSLSAGTDAITTITLAAPIVLTAGSYGVALVATGSAHRYTNGIGTNQNFNDAFLAIAAGGAQNVPWTGAPIANRVWNGSICYVPAAGLFPNFSATPLSGPVGTNVAFTDLTYTSDPAGLTGWLWDFENDGIFDSGLQNPTHTYLAEGVYSVTLQAFDALHGMASVTKTGYVSIDTVDASFTSSVVSGTTVQFTDTSTGGPTSWAWDFQNDGTVDSNLPNPVFTYPSAGAYNCRLTVSDAISTDTIVVNLGVGIIPVPPFGSTFTANSTRGFWFQAPVRFSVVSMSVPDETAFGVQNVALYRLAGAPPVFSASATGGLEFYQGGAPSGTPIPCAVSFEAGEYVGVLGACGTATSLRNSYGTPAGPYASSVLGSPMTLTRFLSQTNIVAVNGTGAYSQEPAAAISRVILGVSACTSIAYGAGSPSGAGPAAPVLKTGALPCLGATAVMIVENQDVNAIGLMAIGVGRASVPTPLGTVLLGSIDVIDVMNGGALLNIGSNSYSFNVPNVPALNGTGPYNWQNANLLVPSGQIALSNGLEWFLAL